MSSTDADPRYFSLGLESLRDIGRWAADCAEKTLPLFESCAPEDARPRLAIAGIREFAAGGPRVARLRTLATGAHAAARECRDLAAKATARAAGAAAASAYTHPLRDVHQTKHVVGAAAYTALALDAAHDPTMGTADDLVHWAIDSAPNAAGVVLSEMEARQPGTSRLDTLLYELDAGIRAAHEHAGGGGTKTPQDGDMLPAKSVAEKGRVKPGTTIALLNSIPAVVDSLGLPTDVSFVEPEDAQLVFLFVRDRAELESMMPAAVSRLGAASTLWVFFRKGGKSAGLDMGRDDVWRIAECADMRPLGLLRVDDTWAAFRLRASSAERS